VRTAAPELGRHGDEILAELGLDAAEQRALREAGVVR
jgi:crotonobetainyl-CoA:carnitine CoA-transferase CaiB-like acyl-CoA transferase